MENIYAGTVDKLPKLNSPTLWMFLVGVGLVTLVVLLLIRPKLIFYKLVFLLMFVFYTAYLLTVTFSYDFNDVSGGTNTILFDTINRYSFGTRAFFNNIIGNVLMMVPYGIFLGVFLHRGRAKIMGIFGIITLIGLAPTLIETGQYIIGRVFDVDDVLLNVGGGLLGYIIYIIARIIYRHLPETFHARWILNISSVILVIILLSGLHWLGIMTN